VGGGGGGGGVLGEQWSRFSLGFLCVFCGFSHLGPACFMVSFYVFFLRIFFRVMSLVHIGCQYQCSY